MVDWKSYTDTVESCRSDCTEKVQSLFSYPHTSEAAAGIVFGICCIYGTRGKKDTEMLLHRCRCGTLIPQGLQQCPDCEAAAGSTQASRHMEYNLHRRNRKTAAFYVSQQWRKTRELTLQLYDGLDLYAYYIQHRIVMADMVHHIMEIEEDWEQRLKVDNLFPLSNTNHGVISALYRRDDSTRKHTQEQLREILRRHWEGAGGIEKVLSGLD